MAAHQDVALAVGGSNPLDHPKYMNEIIFRKAREKDLEKFYKFFSKSVKEDFAKDFTSKTLDYFLKKVDTKETIQKAIEEGYLSLALESDKIIGYLFVRKKPSGGVWFINWLAVDRNYRGKGIAGQLLTMVEMEGVRRGVHCLLLLAVQRNLNFYKNRGFTMLGRMLKGYYGQEDIYFYKIIQEPKEANYLKED